jgi:hypothetical protein
LAVAFALASCDVVAAPIVHGTKSADGGFFNLVDLVKLQAANSMPPNGVRIATARALSV